MSTIITFDSVLAACAAFDRLLAARWIVSQAHCKVYVLNRTRAEVFAAIPPYMRRGAIFEGGVS